MFFNYNRRRKKKLNKNSMLHYCVYNANWNQSDF